MSAEVIELWPTPEFRDYCTAEGCGADADPEYGIQFGGYDIDGEFHVVETSLCRAHGLAFDLVREVKK